MTKPKPKSEKTDTPKPKKYEIRGNTHIKDVYCNGKLVFSGTSGACRRFIERAKNE